MTGRGWDCGNSRPHGNDRNDRNDRPHENHRNDWNHWNHRNGRNHQNDRNHRNGRDRGQTAIDFALGMGVFLLAIAFTFGAIPSLFEPFGGDAGTRAIVADRSADRLTEDLLVTSPDRPSALNETCTEAFFDGGSPPAQCRYDTSSADLQTALGVQDWRSVNVTVENGSEIQTIDGTDLRAGPTPSADDDTVAARRVVRLAGENDRLVVRVW